MAHSTFSAKQEELSAKDKRVSKEKEKSSANKININNNLGILPLKSLFYSSEWTSASEQKHRNKTNTSFNSFHF